MSSTGRLLSFVMSLALALAACDSSSNGAGDATVDAPVADSAADNSVDADSAAPDAPDDLAPDQTPPKLLRAGAAAVDITPGAGVPLGGFGAAPRRVIDALTIPAHIAAVFGNCYDPYPGDASSLFAPNTGKHDPIMARALVLDNGDTKAAFVKLDVIGVSRMLRDDIEKTAASLGIPAANLVVSATHTHSGPGAVSEQRIWQLIAMDCLHKPTYNATIAGIRKALTQAAAALEPAKLGIGATTENNATKNRAGRAGVFDPQLGLIKVTRASDDAPIAALINFAIHGTCLGASNLVYSADVMGYTERELEKLLGGGVALFTNGAEGDVAPAQGGFDGAAALGKIIAGTTHTLWGNVTTKSWVPIVGSFADKKMPKPTLNGCLPVFGASQTICDLIPGITIPLDQLMHDVLPFGALRIDDSVFAAVPGEPITDVGLAIKSEGLKRNFRYTFVVGLSNDYMGYITTADEYKRGQYESQATMFGEKTGDLVVSALASHFDKVKTAPAP